MQNRVVAPRPCDVWGALTLTSDAGDITVEALNDRVTVNIPSPFEAELHDLSDAASLHHDLILTIHEICQAMDVQVVVTLAGHEIAVLGRGSNPGVISKSLSIAPIQIRFFPLLASLLDEKAAKIRRRLGKTS